MIVKDFAAHNFLKLNVQKCEVQSWSWCWCDPSQKCSQVFRVLVKRRHGGLAIGGGEN